MRGSSPRRVGNVTPSLKNVNIQIDTLEAIAQVYFHHFDKAVDKVGELYLP